MSWMFLNKEVYTHYSIFSYISYSLTLSSFPGLVGVVGSGLSSLDNSSMITALSNITHPLHLGMKAIVKIVAAYEDLSDSASQVASAIVNLFPGQYATVELMSFFANLSTAILKSLSGDHNISRQDAMADILTLDCQQIQS